MKFGFRMPSLKKRISARTSLKRIVRHRLGIKAPKGLGVITNPKKYLYNKIYNKTSFGVEDIIKPLGKKRKRKSINQNPVSKQDEIITTNLSDDSTLRCPVCHNEIRIDGFGKFKCPYCKNILDISKSSKESTKEQLSEIEDVIDRTYCPHCNCELNVKDHGTYKCPDCSTVFRI